MSRRRPRLGARLALLMASACLAGAFLPWPSVIEMSIQQLLNPRQSTDFGSVSKLDVSGALKAASRATGVDFAYLTANASLESSMNPNAKAKTSSAAGLFQFIESTWSDMVVRHGEKVGLGEEAKALGSGELSSAERRRIMDLRFNPGVAARMGAEFAAENARHLEAGLGRRASDVDLYMAHFLGPGGAVKFLKQLEATPDGAAAAAFPAAAKANPSVFYEGGKALGFSEIRDRFSAKLASRQGMPMASATGDNSGGRFAAYSTPPTPTAPNSAMRAAASGGGDPWLTTLVNAQLSMNDALSRVDRDGDPERPSAAAQDRPEEQRLVS